MSLSKLRTVVSTNWLRQQIGSEVKKAAKNLRVLETTYISFKDINPKRDFDLYMDGHIPQSLFFDLHKCTESTKQIPMNLPEVNCFTDYVRDLGIHDDTHVVVYDKISPLSSYRTWWLFRLYGHNNISVLDGGLKKWTADGYDVTKEIPEVEKSSSFKAKFDSSLLKDFDDMVNIVKRGDVQIVDGRGYNEFYGIKDFPDGGHIPGSRMLYFQAMFNEDGTLKSEHDLKTLFNGAGIELDKPLVSTCLLGLRATGLAAAAYILGYPNIPVYYGSYCEWRQRAPDHQKVTLKT